MDEARASHGGMRKVLVTGAAGFIGSHLVEAMLQHGCLVRVIDNFSTGETGRVHPSAELFDAGYKKAGNHRQGVPPSGLRLSSSRLTPRTVVNRNPLETHMVNVVGTINVLSAARNWGVRRVVFFGSSSVYGDQSRMPPRKA